MIKVLTILGTRPEAVKLAPILHELEHDDAFTSKVVATGQHREMLDPMLDLFGITPDFDLDLMRPGQSLDDITVGVLQGLQPILSSEQPDWVVVQGDTTSVMAACVAAFYRKCRVAHVEAGLRTFDKFSPFPEEINRRIAGVLADLHFAPTPWARMNLLREGVPADHVRLTGNTVIDAMRHVRRLDFDSRQLECLIQERRLVLVTAHRNENLGERMEGIATGVRKLAVDQPDVHFLYPMHLNPRARESALRHLSGLRNVSLIDPLGYREMVWVLHRAHLVITDSGGLQEEAAGAGTPVLVMRDTTERPEGIEAGIARLVDPSHRPLVEAASRLLGDDAEYQQMKTSRCPYGTGTPQCGSSMRSPDVRQPCISRITSTSGLRPSIRSIRSFGRRPLACLPATPIKSLPGQGNVLRTCRLSSMPEPAVSEAQSGSTGDQLASWLTSGRAQSSGGAFCAWRDANTDALAFEYPEITGYALTWLTASRQTSERYQLAGVKAAGWLAERLAEGDRSARGGWEAGAIYTFDLGMIAAGLISFGRMTGTARFEHVGLGIAHTLAQYIEEAGELPAIAPDGPQTERRGEWSTEGRVHLVKCVQSLLLSGNRDAGRKLLAQAYADQRADGHFVTQPGDELVMLHPHLYTVEGLWMWGMATADDDALDRARRATSWVWEHQLPSGGFPRWVSESNVGPEQLDATGQAIRAAVLLGLNPKGLASARDRLAACARPDGRHGCALVYRPSDIADHLNVWVTMFGEQALSLTLGEAHHFAWQDLV